MDQRLMIWHLLGQMGDYETAWRNHRRRRNQFLVLLVTWFPVFMLAAVLFSLTAVATPSAPQQKSESATKILTLENRWNDAYKQGDITTMNSLLADDFVITVEDGTTFSKAGYIAHGADSDNRVLISEMSELKVRMHGNTAIVTGAYHEKGTSGGKPYEYHDRLTDVWMLMADGRWQIIASHYSILAK